MTTYLFLNKELDVIFFFAVLQKALVKGLFRKDCR